MKIIFLLSMFLLAHGAQAQFGKKLLQQTQEAAKRKAEAKAQQKIDNALDRGVDKADSVVTGKKRKKKKNGEDPGDTSATETVVSSDADPAKPVKAATVTVTTPKGSPFVANKLALPALFFDEGSGSFDPEPNADLNGAGAATKQQIKTKKILIKVYQKTSSDDAKRAETEYTAIIMYLINRYGLDEDRLFFYTPPIKKDGPTRLIEFVAVPETFKLTDASKY